MYSRWRSSDDGDGRLPLTVRGWPSPCMMCGCRLNLARAVGELVTTGEAPPFLGYHSLHGDGPRAMLVVGRAQHERSEIAREGVSEVGAPVVFVCLPREGPRS